ncbi:YceD family protein, partial [Rhizobium leguminosarum]|uniref:YceD family protein n=1 Tax=Rhizobium leguminosarum TaxID=384 RepID=UPI003F9B07A5
MNNQEEDPDVYYIARGESHINVSDWIYEFINLSIPMQRMCADEEIGGPYCNKEVLAMLKKMDVQNSQPTNPLSKGL